MVGRVPHVIIAHNTQQATMSLLSVGVYTQLDRRAIITWETLGQVRGRQSLPCDYSTVGTLCTRTHTNKNKNIVC